ncbi:dephospho-CoA kinase [bacterium]|nr:dephospho-CoA kinase [bacterium]
MKFWGITGGIGSGKSSMLKYLDELGFRVLDADQLARRVTEPAHKNFYQTKKSIIDLVGPQAFDGEVMDRRVVRDWFAKSPDGDTSNKKKLTSILHPLIRDDIKTWMAEVLIVSQKPFAFIEAIDMFDSGDRASLSKILDGVIGVLADDSKKVERASLRDQRPAKDVESILAMQMSDAELEAKAQLLIKNDGNLSEFRSQILKLLDKMTSS